MAKTPQPDIEFDAEPEPFDVAEMLQQERPAPTPQAGQRPNAAAMSADIRLSRIEKAIAQLATQRGTPASRPELSGYDAECHALIEDEKRIMSEAVKITSGILRSYGPSQLVTKDDYGAQRLNGIVITRCGLVSEVSQTSDGAKTVSATKTQRAIGNVTVEVWGYLEAGKREKIGLLVCFPEQAVSAIVSLRSDLHVSPDA
jgi:hypothetical protein